MTIDDLKADATRLGNDLQTAMADAAMFDRLRGAAGEVQRLTEALAVNANDQHAAEVAALPVDQQAVAADIRNVSIALDPMPTAEAYIPGSALTISWEARSTDATMNPSGWGFSLTDSFRSLSVNVLRYITEVRPDVLPAIIAGLVPGDPLAAITRYTSIINAARLPA